MNCWLIWLMIDTATPFGFCLAGSVGAVHCVSDMTPKLQGSADADVAPMNIASTNANANTVLKQNSFFICPFI